MKRLLLVILVVGVLGGCRGQTLAEGLGFARQGNSSQDETMVSLGKIGDGECLLESQPQSSVIVGNHTVYKIVCEQWAQAGAELFVLPRQVDIDANSLESFVETGNWRRALDVRLECTKGARRSDTPANIDAYGAVCALRQGGWEVNVLAIHYEDKIVLYEGLKELIPYGYRAMELLVNPDAMRQAKLTTEQQETTSLRSRLRRSGAETSEAAGKQEFTNLLQLGQLYNGYGANDQAEETYRKALDLHEKRFGVGDPRSVTVIMNIALEASNQSRFTEAERLFSIAEALVASSNILNIQARFASYRAQHLANQGDHGLALDQAREAETLWQKLFNDAVNKAEITTVGGSGVSNLAATSPEAAEIINALYIQAFMHLRLGNIEESLDLLDQCKQRLARSLIAPRSWFARLETLAATIWVIQGDLVKAQASAERVIETRADLFKHGRYLAISYGNLADILLKAGNHEEALKAYRKMLELVSNSEFGSVGLTFDRLRQYLDLLLLRARATEDPEARLVLHQEMFQVVQYSQEGVASESIARATIRLASTEVDAGAATLFRSMQRARTITEELRFRLRHERTKSADSRNLDYEKTLAERIRTLGTEADRLAIRINTNHPNISAEINPRPVSVEEVQKALHPNEAVLYYTFGRDGGFVFAIRSDGVSVKVTKFGHRTLTAEILELRRPFGQIAAGGILRIFDMKLAHRLYRRLFQQSIAFLEGVDTLAVHSSGALASLPFSVLLAEKPPAGAENYQAATWLANRFSIFYIPAVRSFVQTRTNRNQVRSRSNQRQMLALAAVNYYGSAAGSSELAQQCRAGQIVDAKLIHGLLPLPETRNEVEGIGQLLGRNKVDILLGDQASEIDFRKHKLDQYRILYFATHGLLPGELRCLSEPGLALSPPRNNRVAETQSEDGMLDASEITRLELDADLVVLSACNTGGSGVGELGGEALSGLARAFFVAGARNLIVSHWVLPSEAAVVLTTEIFRRMTVESANIGDAVRTARLSMINQPRFSHPVFWGPLVPVGDGAFKLSVSRTISSRQSGISP